MISIHRLQALLSQYPADSVVTACEGERIGLIITCPSGQAAFIAASPHANDDEQPWDPPKL
jgi:hypothetical protein